MSMRFLTPNGIQVGNMSNGRSQLFVAITTLAAHYHGIENPGIGVSEEGGDYIVDPLEFCKLVETAFDRPNHLLYTWAEVATAIYEAIKGERYTWRWPDGEAPFPRNQSMMTSTGLVDFVPDRHCGRTIGKD